MNVDFYLATFMSDDDDYDSEEERVRARLHTASLRHHIQAEKTRQQHLLRDYRARQQAAAGIREAARQDTIRKGLPSCHHHSRESHHDDGSGSAHISNNNGDDQDDDIFVGNTIAKIRRHEADWEDFIKSGNNDNDNIDNKSQPSTTSPSPPLTYTDIPWPPLQNMRLYLKGLSHLMKPSLNVQKHSDNDNEDSIATKRLLKKAYGKASLRWHPDRWQEGGVTLQRISMEDRDRVLDSVKDVSQRINIAWECLDEL